MKNKRFRQVGLAGSIIVIIASATLAISSLKKTVTLQVNGQQLNVRTWAWTVGQALAQSNVALTPYDQVNPPASSILANGQTIAVRRARAVLLKDGSQMYTVYTASEFPLDWLAVVGISAEPGWKFYADGREIEPGQPSSARLLSIDRLKRLEIKINGVPGVISSTSSTLAGALLEAGYSLRLADILEPSPSTPLTDGLQAEFTQAREFKIVTIHGEYSVLSAAKSVGQALAQNGLALQGLDYSLPADSQPLPSDGLIRIVHVQEVFVATQSTIPFEMEYQADPDTEIDQQSVLKVGQVGIQEQRVRVRYEDGKEISRINEGTFLIRPARNQVVGYGTKLVMHTIDTPDGPINYWRAIDMVATSYNPTSAGGSTTASGLKLKKGVVAVDRRYIPFFTRLYIPGYGEAVAADIGGKVIGRIIDLGYEDSDYVAWYKHVTVYFLWPPPANIVWIFP